MTHSTPLHIATFGGGCFWCIETIFADLRGVQSAISGYMGGHVVNPTYEQVCGKNTGHVEVVQVTFDPAAIAYRDLLEVFFVVHDPTTPNRQGNDVGPQYRSAIFHHDAGQKDVATAVIAELTAERVFPAAIVTELLPAATFYPAEAYHQDYYNRTGDQNPYCSYVITPKVAKFRQKFAALRK
jgi:peptide-methionine (S)-S-oxide reductase